MPDEFFTVIFTMIDKDKSGTLEREEVMKFMTAVIENKSDELEAYQEELTLAIEKFDTPGLTQEDRKNRMGAIYEVSERSDVLPEKLPVIGDESIMSKKANGSCDRPPQPFLRFGVDETKANRICCFNRKFAEESGYAFSSKVSWLETLENQEKQMVYYDSVTGRPLFVAPQGRSKEEFIEESRVHGWPSFRDEDVVWENVRCLEDGECVSVDGTHLGHNIPDEKGNRYCINLVSIAGNPVVMETKLFRGFDMK